VNGLNALSEEKFLLINQYIGLLDVIEEAFGHIFLCLEEMRLEDAQHLWDDVSMAFMQILESNKVLAEHFTDRPGVRSQFTRFETVWEKAQALHYTDYSLWKEMLGDRIYPAFSEWSREINKQYRLYYIN
jgi:hypothetical protein